MELSDAELQEFKGRALQAVTYGYQIGLAEEYMTALASEVGQEIVPEGLTKASAEHLYHLAVAVEEQRASGGKKAKKATKAKPEPKVEELPPVVKDEEPAKTEEPKKDEPEAAVIDQAAVVKDEELPAKTEPDTTDGKDEEPKKDEPADKKPAAKKKAR